MSKEILAAIPIKPFGVAKRRLSTRLDAPARSRLGKAVAARTAAAAVERGAHDVVTAGGGRAQQHRHVAVMTTGMHDTGVLAGMGQARGLIDRQAVHVCAKADGTLCRAASQAAHNPGFGQTAMNLISKRGQPIRNRAAPLEAERLDLENTLALAGGVQRGGGG